MSFSHTLLVLFNQRRVDKIIGPVHIIKAAEYASINSIFQITGNLIFDGK
jgi:hypothetical protein